MLIYRWQSPIVPEADQIRLFFEREGLEPSKEIYKSGQAAQKHIHSFDEVRMICDGEMLFDLSGNRLLLRGGDRIIIPSNTWHTKSVQGSKDCISFCAFKAH